MESDDELMKAYRAIVARLAYNMVFDDNLNEVQIMILVGHFCGHIQANMKSKEAYKEEVK